MSDRSDFNDLAAEEGGAEVAKAVDAAIARAAGAGPLATMAQRPAGQKPKPASRLILALAASIQPEPIRWLMRGAIALGKLTLIAGDPGLGKSMLTANLAAHVTTARDWPAGMGACPGGDVLFVSAEDDPADTIRPRLDAAGADPARVHILTGVESLNGDGDTERRMLSLRKDLSAIREAVLSMDCRLIVIDPISAYLDGSDSHNNADVRALLAPLGELAREVGAAVVAVTHLNKGTGGSALYRATGSLAFVAAARAAYLVTRDKSDESRRLFLPLKNNLGPDSAGLAYTIEQTSDGVPFVRWSEERVDVTADDALGRPEEHDHETTLAADAEEWLRDVLALGPVPSEDVKVHAKAAGYSWATIRRAQAAIGIKPKRTGGAGGRGTWAWALPDGQEPDQMPLPNGEGA